MANGYSQTTYGASSRSTTSRSRTNQQGKMAPEGYHYMPDGKLMSDAEHALKFGAEHTIIGLDLDTSDLKISGEQRSFTIEATPGAKFSMFITNEDNYYYNFNTRLFQATQYRLNNITVEGGFYSNNIVFPLVGDADQYDVFLFAEVGTKHAEYKEVRFADNSIDINKTTGSDSLLIKKVLYQKANVDLTITPISPTSSNDFDSMSVTTQVITTQYDKVTSKLPFSITATSASTKAFQIKSQPTAKHVFASVTRTLGEHADIDGENLYPTATTAFTGDDVNGAITSGVVVRMDNTDLSAVIKPGDKITSPVTTDTVNGAVSSGVNVRMNAAVATKMAVGDRVTGTVALDARTITVATLVDTNIFALSDSVVISDGVTLTFSSKVNRSLTTVGVVETSGTATDFTMSQAIQFRDDQPLTFANKRNYSFGIDNIDGLADGMTVTGARIDDATTIKRYSTTAIENEGTSYASEKILKEKRAIESYVKPTITRNATTKLVTTTRVGDISFNQQQPLDAESSSITIRAYGRDQIKTLTGWDVDITDLKVELTDVTTTTTAAVHSSTTVPIASGDGIVEGVSVVSGIGIDSSVADPTVTTINSYSGTTASIVLSAAQILESGTRLTFTGSGELATITGNVKIIKTGIAALTLNFDLEKFMVASNEAS
tara:strand:- start:13348 stop:15330 length:1983 start_codon:yes stop_codon:yes gene_type:complete